MSDLELYKGLQEKLRSKIKEQFVDLIPEEEWDKMIESEFDKFTKGENCDMRIMIREEIKTQIGAAIKEEMSKSCYQTQWDNHGYRGVSEAVTKMIRQHSEEIVVALVGNIVQTAVENMRNSLQPY